KCSLCNRCVSARLAKVCCCCLDILARGNSFVREPLRALMVLLRCRERRFRRMGCRGERLLFEFHQRCAHPYTLSRSDEDLRNARCRRSAQRRIRAGPGDDGSNCRNRASEWLEGGGKRLCRDDGLRLWRFLLLLSAG